MGADQALLGGNINAVFHGADGFGNVFMGREGDYDLNDGWSTSDKEELISQQPPPSSDVIAEHAVHALWKYVTQYPSEITI